MSRVDLHPEELLDALRREGTLAPDDRARLEQHLDACDPCTFEQVVLRDFTRELDRQEPADAPAAAGALLGALSDPRLAAQLAPGGGARGWSAPRKRARWLLVAAILLAATTGAAAAAWYALVVIGRRAEPAAPPACPAGESGLAGSVVYSAPDATGAPPVEPRGGPGTRGVEPPPPAEVVPEPSARPEGVPARPVAPAAADAGPEPADAAGLLFSRANAARRARDYGTAATLYDELGRRFGGTREELLARVTYGTLLLDVLGQPQRALGLFDSYLAAARGGTMAEEALVGRAVALGRLGRPVEERAAWHALLAEFPDSAHAERARRRLAELP
jgi:hypothetical protein